MVAEQTAGQDDGTEIGRSAATFARGILDLVGAEAVTVSTVEHDELVVVAVAGTPVPPIGERRPATLDGADEPVRSSSGDLVGAVRIVLPAGAPPPSPARQAVLDRFVGQATAAIGNAVERARLNETVRLTRVGRRIVRQLAGISSLASIEEPISATLCDAFGAVGLRLRFTDSDLPTHVYSRPGFDLRHDPRLDPLAHLAARQLWTRQRVAVIGAGRLLNTVDSPEIQAEIIANGLSSELLIPIGFAEECLGSLVLLRAAGAPAWSSSECDAGLEIGRDLGHLLRQARSRARERQLIRELSALSDYRDGLIHIVSEQLQGPLDAIHAHLADLMSRSGDGASPPTGRDRPAIDAISRNAQQMTRVVDDLLLLARLAHPDREEEAAEVDLKAAIRRVVDPITAAAGRRGLQVETHLPALPVIMRGNQSHVERMLVELLSNAVKYTPSGGRIRVRLGRFEKASVLLTVSDTGIGIPPEEQARVFDDFFRGSSPEVTATSGSGLGLAIVERIVRRHGGHIRLSSTPGRGTTFNVGLPLG